MHGCWVLRAGVVRGVRCVAPWVWAGGDPRTRPGTAHCFGIAPAVRGPAAAGRGGTAARFSRCLWLAGGSTRMNHGWTTAVRFGHPLVYMIRCGPLQSQFSQRPPGGGLVCTFLLALEEAHSFLGVFAPWFWPMRARLYRLCVSLSPRLPLSKLCSSVCLWRASPWRVPACASVCAPLRLH